MAVPPTFHNPNLGMKNVHDYTWGKADLPTRENCDLENPREMFLWMFTAPPGVNGAPLVFPTEVFMMWSEHLYECGARLGAEPMKKYRRPTGTEPNRYTTPGRWVPVDEPDPTPNPAREAWNALSWQQKAEIAQLVHEHEKEDE
jgi:hypothetical protein